MSRRRRIANGVHTLVQRLGRYLSARPLLSRFGMACTLAFVVLTAAAQQSTHEKTPPPAKVTEPAPTPAAAAGPSPAPPESRSDKGDAAATPPPAPGPVTADGAAVTGDPARTRLAIDLTGPVEFQVFRLTAPARVVIDLSHVEFTMPPAVGRAGTGLVRSFRFGAFATGKSRVVIETTGPVKVEATRLLREGARGRHRLEVELVPSATVELTEGEVAAAIEGVARLKHGEDGNAQL